VLDARGPPGASANPGLRWRESISSVRDPERSPSTEQRSAVDVATWAGGIAQEHAQVPAVRVGRWWLTTVRPLPNARWVVFTSLADGSDGGAYYDCHRIEHMHHRLSILAYEMNDRPLTVEHGAPLRLRNEVELGFKQVKWIRSIELVESFEDLGAGQAGYNEDHEFFGYRMPI
jgi:Oxidoreductase molybdopterin binding domain